MSKFDSRGINDPAFACSVSRANIAHNGAYFTQIKQLSSISPAFCTASFNASYKFVIDICWSRTWGKRILLPRSSILTFSFVACCFWFLYTTYVQGCSKACAGLEAATDA